MGSTGGLSAMPSPEKELLDKVNSWVNNLKKQTLEKIDAEMDDLYLETKSYVEKGFFGNLFNGVANFFKGIGDKIGKMVRNVVNWAKTVVKKADMWFHGVEKYEIIFSGGDNACETCKEMAGEIFARDELSIGNTAPPFHPNCRCKIIPYVDREMGSEKEDSSETSDNIKEYVSLEQLKGIGFKNITDVMVKELNEMLEKYGIITKDQIAHFLSQCYVESGTWRTEIDWAKNNFAHITGGPDYRGAGAIHLSHKYNYEAFLKSVGVDIDKLKVPPYKYVDENYYWEAGGWYWQENKVNQQVGKEDAVLRISRLVNCGSANSKRQPHGLKERRDAYARAWVSLR